MSYDEFCHRIQTEKLSAVAAFFIRPRRGWDCRIGRLHIVTSMTEAWDLENCFFKCKTFSSPKQQQQLQIAGDGCDGGESPSSCFLFQKINNEKILLSSKVLPFASNHYWKCHREKWAALGASLSRIWLNNENLIHLLHVNLMEICRQSFESCANRVTWCWSFTRCLEKLCSLIQDSTLRAAAKGDFRN